MNRYTSLLMLLAACCSTPAVVAQDAPKADSQAALNYEVSGDIDVLVDALASLGLNPQAAEQGVYAQEDGEDTVARRLRIAAEQETEPALRLALWREYRQYVTSQRQLKHQDERGQRDALASQQTSQRQEEQRQATVRAEQERLNQEREQIYWSCVSSCSASSGATALQCMSQCKARPGQQHNGGLSGGGTTNRPPARLKNQYRRGMSRICIYERLGNDEAYTVEVTEICPAIIK